MGKVKMEIKHRYFGSVLFEYEKENNTIKDTLEKAVEEGADLRGADLRGANLIGADLEGADLRGANLIGAYLRGANLRGADLEGADLRGANLIGADLEGANLIGAYLEGADLRGANLIGADLEGADLEGADLRGAIISSDDDEININEVINNFIGNTNIKKLSVYENHNQIPTRWSSFWNNVIVVNEWKLKEEEPEVKEMTVSEISEKLGYEVKVIK